MTTGAIVAFLVGAIAGIITATYMIKKNIDLPIF